MEPTDCGKPFGEVQQKKTNFKNTKKKKKAPQTNQPNKKTTPNKNH